MQQKHVSVTVPAVDEDEEYEEDDQEAVHQVSQDRNNPNEGT